MAALEIVAAVRWVDTAAEVDPLSGDVRVDPRTGGFSAADRAAVEVALRLAEAWLSTLTVVSAGGAEIEPALRSLAAAGASRIVRVQSVGQLPSVLSSADVVVCGDLSTDGGTGSVPGWLAHQRGAAQALGLVAVEAGPPGEVNAVRRLGAGRSERIRVVAPSVLSVEGSVATLRRAPLRALREPAAVEVVDTAVVTGREPRVVSTGPWRPRPRVLAPPAGREARDRIVALTGALVDRTPPRRVELDPSEAADVILEQLRAWGYLP